MELLIIVQLSMLITLGIIGIWIEYNQRKRHKEHMSMLDKISWNTFNITKNTINLKRNAKRNSD